MYENPSIGTTKFNTRAKSFYPRSNLNARAHFFLPRNYTNMPDVFNPTERLRHSSIPHNFIYFSSFDLNPCGKAFAPKCKKHAGDGVTGTFIFIVVILSIYIIMVLISSMQVTFDICPKDRLRKLKLDNPNKIVIGHLKINSIRQKFVPLTEIIGDNIDILLISETKINSTFPVGQFY